MTYHYIVASLPTLVLGEPPPFSAEEFRARCGGVLSEGDLAEMDAVLSGQPGDRGVSDFTRAWLGADAQIRNAAARFRGGKLGVESKSFLREHFGFNGWLEKSVADAFAKPNPLEREMELDLVRWQFLDEQATRAPFSLAAVLAFAIKLKLAARWAAMKEPAARERLEAWVAGLEQEPAK